VTDSLAPARDMPTMCLMGDLGAETRNVATFGPMRRARLARFADACCRRILAAAGSRVAVACVLVMALGWIAIGPITAVGRGRDAVPCRLPRVRYGRVDHPAG